MQDTSKQYNAVIQICRSLFIKKMKDYGCAWRILRLPSLTDQIF
ncbi:nucleotide modification associated domain-containing protein, partial [Zunongwangia profunda]